jgi:hypothetical protein
MKAFLIKRGGRPIAMGVVNPAAGLSVQISSKRKGSTTTEIELPVADFSEREALHTHLHDVMPAGKTSRPKAKAKKLTVGKANRPKAKAKKKR